jgi:hypothetical protein
MNYSNRTYATALLSDIDKVDFSQVMETSPNTIRKSVDQTQFVLKWYTENEPTFITDKSVTLTWSGSHSDCLQLMSTIEWTPEIEG